jgi:hypothetical protein
MKVKWLFPFILMVTLLAMITVDAKAEELSDHPTSVNVSVTLINIEKVDLAANSYRLDFYLTFLFNSSEIGLNEVKEFEFINGAPSKYEIYVNETEGYLEYRVKGDFIKTFDFTRYPFETHKIVVELEHKNLNIDKLIFQAYPTSNIDEGINVVGWDLGDLETRVVEHSYDGTSYSRFIFDITLKRPILSSFIKSILPIAVITTISLLAFFVSPQNFSQRIGLGVTTLLSASAFHLSLLSGIPPTGYLTLADRMMLSIYSIFLYNLSVSVYIMKLVDAKRIEEAEKFNKKAFKILLILIVILIIVQFGF